MKQIALYVAVLALLQVPYNLDIINAPEAHGVQRGSPDIIIAIVDSGVDMGHPEFQGRLVPGFDFVNYDADPSDDHGHGTGMASTAAGKTLGVCPGCLIMPIKVLNQANSGTWAWVEMGIRYAIDNGADVINLSLGSESENEGVKSAVQLAVDSGIVVIAASGNFPNMYPYYPASYDGVYGVGSTDGSDSIWRSSVSGPHVYVSAPGVVVEEAQAGGGTSYRTGTSVASAHVSGLAGLVLSEFPSARPEDVMLSISRGAKDLGECGPDIHYGNGRIDALPSVLLGTAIPPRPPCLNLLIFPWTPVVHER